ncbi:MAG: aldehyde dehydrogenase family protein, partial [Sulfitobacter sp.]|nr:aldehyde dehydrogenase family protein [Sulfitobacter sp.]
MTQHPHYQLFIDGAWTEGSTGQVMETKNPATGADWATFACASPQDVERAIAAARRSLNDPAWRDMTQTQRGKLLYRLAELIEENAADLGRVETTDSGKLLAETSSQTRYVGDYYRYYAGLADKIEGAVLPIDKPDMHVFTRREPLGVVVA